MARNLFGFAFAVLLLVPIFSLAQQGVAVIDASKVPLTGSKPADFVPAGWKLEAVIEGDLNGDAVPDYALKLVEDKPPSDDRGASDRQRALVVLFGTKAGQLSRAGVAGRLLQCTTCGGILYGVLDAPVGVTIEKGILIVKQDHGSRDVTAQTFRFRYEPDTKRFALIGFDFTYEDRATGETASESTNYLTGQRVVERTKESRKSSSRKGVPKEKIYLEQVDSERFEEAASERLHL